MLLFSTNSKFLMHLARTNCKYACTIANSVCFVFKTAPSARYVSLSTSAAFIIGYSGA